MVDYMGKKSCKLEKVIDMWVFDSPLKKVMLLFNLLLQKFSSKVSNNINKEHLIRL